MTPNHHVQPKGMACSMALPCGPQGMLGMEDNWHQAHTQQGFYECLVGKQTDH